MLVGTLFGTGGPLYVMYLTLRGLGKMDFRASFAIYFLVDGTLRLAGYGWVGYFGADALWKIASALPFAAIGLFAGGRIYSTLSPVTFKRIISVLLLGSGTALLLKY